MAQWHALHELVRKEKIKAQSLTLIYGHRMQFPVTLRSKYATWIESKEWLSDTTSVVSVDEAEKRYQEFVDLLQNNLEQMAPGMEQISFKNTVDEFVDNFQYRYQDFMQVISTILRTENTLILSSKEPNQGSQDGGPRISPIAQDNPEIETSLNHLRGVLRSTENGLNRLEEDQEKYLLDINELQEKICQQKKQLDKDQEAKKRLEKMEKEFNEYLKKLHSQRTAIMNSLHAACTQLDALLKLVWTEIDAWKADQRVACTMLRKPKDNIMEVLDRMGEKVGEVFTSVLKQIDRLVNLLQKVAFQQDNVLTVMRDNIRPYMMDLLKKHLEKVFIVDKNIPKQVLKVTNGKSLGFSMSVRFLGGFALGLKINQPKVSVRLYPEKQINDVMDTKWNKDAKDGTCKIQNGQDKAFEFLRSGNCMANFNNMVVSNVKREGRGRNDDFVTDYKHAFVFMTTVKILFAYCQDTRDFDLKARSLPLVITSQTSQECMARGTIIWSAAFPKHPMEEKDLPFQAMEEVPWLKVAEVINALFKEYTGRPLTANHLRYLAKIAFRESKDLDFDKMSISRNLILKDKLPNRKEFPFWKWLMACLNSVKGTLHSEWKENFIYGFISKDEAERKLQDQPCGTFLIRFSESNIDSGQSADIQGYLTVAVSEVNPSSGCMSVFHVKESLTPKDLKERKLAPILEAYETDDYTTSSSQSTRRSKKLLQQLWTPSGLIPFDEAFGKYIEAKESMNDGYHRGRYLIKIYLADTSDKNWPMSPPAFPGSPALSDMTYSDAGSPHPDILPMPNMGMTAQPPLTAPVSQNQNVGVVTPMGMVPQQAVQPQQQLTNGELTLNQLQFTNLQTVPMMNGLEAYPQQQTQQPIGTLDNLNFGNFANLDLQALNQLMENNQISPEDSGNAALPILMMDSDNDVMLNSGQPVTSSQFTGIGDAVTISLSQQYQ